MKEPLNARLIKKLINKTLRQSLRVAPNQMINMPINVPISPQNLFNKWNQSNRKYTDLPVLLSHLLDFYNLESINNARRWDATKLKNGQPKLDLHYLHYLTLKTTISHVSRRLRLPITYPDPTDTPCQLDQIDG